jgi:hypothetical protein
MAPRTIAVLSAALLLTAACSGDDDSSAATPAVETSGATTDAPATSAPPTTDGVPPTVTTEPVEVDGTVGGREGSGELADAEQIALRFDDAGATVDADEIACLVDAGITTDDVDQLFDQDGDLDVEVAEALDGCLGSESRASIVVATASAQGITEPCFVEGVMGAVVEGGFAPLAGDDADTAFEQIYLAACGDRSPDGERTGSFYAQIFTDTAVAAFAGEPDDEAVACLDQRYTTIDETYDLERLIEATSGVDDVTTLEVIDRRALLEVGLAPYACGFGDGAPYDTLVGQPGVAEAARAEFAEAADDDVTSILVGLLSLASDGGEGDSAAAVACSRRFVDARLADRPAEELLESILTVDVGDPATSELFVGHFNCTSGQTDWTDGQPAVGDIEYPAP